MTSICQFECVGVFEPSLIFVRVSWGDAMGNHNLELTQANVRVLKAFGERRYGPRPRDQFAVLSFLAHDLDLSWQACLQALKELHNARELQVELHEAPGLWGPQCRLPYSDEEMSQILSINSRLWKSAP